MSKTEVYSWRVSREVKEALEEESRQRGVSMASLVEEAVVEYLARPESDTADDEAEQARILARAAPFFGSIRGGDPDRSSQVRERVRARLLEKQRRRPAPR